jgi:hypothetical protein
MCNVCIEHTRVVSSRSILYSFIDRNVNKGVVCEFTFSRFLLPNFQYCTS